MGTFLDAVNAAHAAQQSQAPAPSGGGFLNTLENLLPTIGGTVGAIGGGILTAGLGGEVVGGAGGSSLGEALKEYLQGGSLNAGQIAEQGAIGGAGSLVGAGLGTLGRALGIGGQAAGDAAGTAAADAASAGTEAQVAKVGASYLPGDALPSAEPSVASPQSTQSFLQNLFSKGTPSETVTPSPSVAPTTSPVGSMTDITAPPVQPVPSQLALPSEASSGNAIGNNSTIISHNPTTGVTSIHPTGFTLPTDTTVPTTTAPVTAPVSPVETSPTTLSPTVADLAAKNPTTPMLEAAGNTPPVINGSAPTTGTVADQLAKQGLTLKNGVLVPTDVTPPATGIAGKLQDAGAALKARVVNPDVNASPTGALSEAQLVKTAQDAGLTGTAANQYKQLPGIMDTLGNNISTQLSNNTATLAKSDLVASIGDQLKSDPNFDQTSTAVASAQDKYMNIVDKTLGNGNTVTASDLFNAKQAVGNAIGTKGWTRAAAGNATAADNAGIAIWKALDAPLTSMAPEVKGATLLQSKLYALAPGLEANRGKSVLSLPLGLGKIAPTVQQALMDKAANTLTKAGIGAAKQPTALAKVISTYLGQAGTRGAVSSVLSSGATGSSGQLNTNLSNPNAPLSSLNQGSTTSSASPTDTSQSIGSTIFSPENIQKLALADLATTGGKNIAALVSLESLMNSTQKAASPALTTAQQAQHDSIATALNSLDAAQNGLVAAGGAQGVMGHLANIPLLGQYLNAPGAAYESAKIETATSIAKAITGSSRAPASIVQQILTSLPDVTDTPEFATQKINNLTNQLLSKAQAFGYTDLVNQYNSPNQ